MTKPAGYSRDSVERALTHHVAKGVIKYWDRAVGPGHSIALQDDDITTRTLHESFAFVMALRSAELAHERNGSVR